MCSSAAGKSNAKQGHLYWIHGIVQQLLLLVEQAANLSSASDQRINVSVQRSITIGRTKC